MTHTQFQQQFMQQLNPQQKEAVCTTDGAVLLLAVPGSGKTTVLVTRLGYMVHCKDIAPSQILTMTYTRAAALEMKSRFAGLFGSHLADSMRICTINSLSREIVGFYSEKLGKEKPFDLIQPEESAQLVGQLYQQLNGEYPTESTVKDIRTTITYIKNMRLTGDDISKFNSEISHMDQLYRLYCSSLVQQKQMDYDDQMVYALTVLQKYPAILNYFQDRYPYICVDESQDTSKIQHEIIQMLAQKYQNLFMVGDEDQSIYGFRAAYPQALLSFETTYPDAKILYMEHNYRSTQQIVSAANSFVAKNRFRRPKQMIPHRGSGGMVQKIHVTNRMAQHKFLFHIGADCSEETAILYRNNDSALPLIDLFERNHVPYNCKEFEDAFFTHRIVTDLAKIIRFSYNMHDPELFMDIYYKFGSPISKIAAVSACEESLRTGKSILEELVRCPHLSRSGTEAAMDLQAILSALPEQPAEAALAQIWNILNYSSYVNRQKLDTGKYDILCLLAKQERSPMDLLRRLQELRGLIKEHVNQSQTKLTLSTVHSSKGLEYDRVFLLDVLEGILPAKRQQELKTAEDIQNYEEDRRIYYVAMTRAKHQLCLFTCPGRDSQFTAEILSTFPQEIIDPNDIFSSLRQNLCGKTYLHREFGKGTILAHCQDHVLVEYRETPTQLLTLGQMLENRELTAAYAPAAPQRSTVTQAEADCIGASIQIGSRVTHKSFGPGIVLGIVQGVAEIRFEESQEIKRIMLDVTVRNGILR